MIPGGHVHKKIKIIAPLVVVAVIVLVAIPFFHTHPVAVLSPAGPVARKERNLIYFALALSLVVVVPVFAMLFGFAWKYRETNTTAKYSPELAGNKGAETIWWGVPTILIVILSVVTWNSSHDLDPFKPLVSSKAPVHVQVVSLDWKWLFIYPDKNIATVNYLEIPVNTPVDFEITSDTVMNSLWIPRLGGQIYAMPGMSTELNLMASQEGTFKGSSANISGKGFAGMHFPVHSVSEDAFTSWVQHTQHAGAVLNAQTYAELARPSENNPANNYVSVQNGLFDSILSKYGMHMDGGSI